MEPTAARPQSQHWRARTARHVVATAFEVTEEQLLHRSRARADIAFARQVAMYLSHVVFRLGYNEVADDFGRERSTVAHACAVVEDARDDPDFDAKLDRLTDRLQALHRLRTQRKIAGAGRLAVILDGAEDGPGPGPGHGPR